MFKALFRVIIFFSFNELPLANENGFYVGIFPKGSNILLIMVQQKIKQWTFGFGIYIEVLSCIIECNTQYENVLCDQK